MKRFSLMLIVLLLPASVHARAAEEPEIVVEMNRSRIYEGESVLYRVTLNRVKGPVEPDFSAFSDFDLELLGEEPFNFSMHSNINGRIREITRYGITLNYSLTPKKAGTFTVPSPLVEVDGKSLTGRSLTLEVVAPGDQDLAVPTIELDREEFFLLQPFTVTLTIDVKALPAPYEKESPVSLRNQVPSLTIPWGTVPQGLTADPMPELNWLSPFSRSGRGFGINGHRTRMSFFDNPRLQRFDLESRRVTIPDASGKETDYVRYSLKRRFVPVQLGEFTFGPALLKGVFVTGVNASRELEVDDVYAIAKPVTVRVRDAPLEGRPGSFTGAVGWFELEADLKPRQARVGDPLTLTLTLTGEGTLDMASAPDISRIDAVKDSFTVYDATEETEGRERIFTYSIRPQSADVAEFPQVEVAFYDVGEGRYVTLETEPIPIEVEPAIAFDEDPLFTGPAENGRKRKLEFLKEGIFPNVVVLSSQRDETVHPVFWAALMAGMVLFYWAAFLGTRIADRRFGDPKVLRRRSAPGRALAALRQAGAMLEEGRYVEGKQRLSGALTGFVGDVTAASVEGITHRDVRRRLIDLGLSDEAALRLALIVEECDAAKYGTSEREAGELRSEAVDALGAAVMELKALGRLK